MRVHFNPVNAGFVGDVGARLTFMPGLDEFPVFDQPAFSPVRKANLQGDAASNRYFVPHPGDFFLAFSGETESSGRAGQIVANKGVTPGQCIEDFVPVLNLVTSQRPLEEQVSVYCLEVKFVGKEGALQWTKAGWKGVSVGAADSDYLAAIRKQLIPASQRFCEGAMRNPLGIVGIKDGMELAFQQRLEFGHAVPQLNSGEVPDVPVNPGNIRFAKGGSSRIYWMGDKGQSPSLVYRIDQALWFLGHI